MKRRRAASTPTSTRSPRTASRTWRTSSRPPSPRGLDGHRHHRPRADRRRRGGAAIAAGRGLPVEVIVGEEVTTRNGHLVGLFLSRAHPALGVDEGRDRAHPRPGRPRHRGAPDGALPTVRQRGHHPPAAGRGRPASPPRRDRGLQPHHGADALEPARPRAGSRSWASPPWPARTRTGHRGRARRDPLPGPLGEPTCARPWPPSDTAWDGRAYTWQEQLGMFGRQQRKNAPPSGTRCAARSSATARGATSDTRAAAPAGALRPRRGRPGRGAGLMKVGLVTPYIFPLPGGVNAHVG